AGLRLHVSTGALLRLHTEALLLLDGVVELAERVADLGPADEPLEALDDLVAALRQPCERRETHGVVVQEGRVDQPRLDVVGERMVDELRPRFVLGRFDAALLEQSAKLALVRRPET